MTQREEEIDGLLRDMRKGLEAEPKAGVVIGTLHLTGNLTFDVAVGACDFTPLHWVALADAALEWALTRYAAAPAPQERDAMMRIEQARAALDFDDGAKQ